MPSRNADTRHVTDEAVDPRERYSLYRLCDCSICEGRGQVPRMQYERHPNDPEDVVPIGRKPERCRECRGEGKVRQELATAETPEAVGLALVTLAREGEWTDAAGQPCAFGLLDREGEKYKKWLVLPWTPSPRNVRDAAKLLRSKRQ